MSFLAAVSKSLAFSSISANCESDSATIVLRMMFGSEIENVEPSIRNSNLLPVKAKGDVRLRSVLSFLNAGKTLTPVSRVASFSE